MKEIQHKFIVLTAPSGAGKTTIARALLKRIPALEFSISATTRDKRDTEQNGVDYYFFSEAKFRQAIVQQEFIEYEEVYQGCLYGTLKSELNRISGAQKIPVLDIDVNGALRIKEQYQIDCLSIFIEPPSLSVLERRLKKRNTETVGSLKKRIDRASYELELAKRFDLRIINDDLNQAINEVENSILAFMNKENVGL